MLKHFKIQLFILIAIVLFSCNNAPKLNDDNIQSENNIQSLNNNISQETIVVNNKNDIELQLVADSLNIDLRLKLASIYYADREFDNAIVHYLKVYEINPKNLIALISLGNLYYDSEQHEKAIEFYSKALELDPNNLNVRCDMGTSYGKTGNVDMAIKIYRENIDLDFNHAQSHYNLAIFLEQIGDSKEAQKEMVIFNGLRK